MGRCLNIKASITIIVIHRTICNFKWKYKFVDIGGKIISQAAFEALRNDWLFTFKVDQTNPLRNFANDLYRWAFPIQNFLMQNLRYIEKYRAKLVQFTSDKNKKNFNKWSQSSRKQLKKRQLTTRRRRISHLAESQWAESIPNYVEAHGTGNECGSANFQYCFYYGKKVNDQTRQTAWHGEVYFCNGKLKMNAQDLNEYLFGTFIWTCSVGKLFLSSWNLNSS